MRHGKVKEEGGLEKYRGVVGISFGDESKKKKEASSEYFNNLKMSSVFFD